MISSYAHGASSVALRAETIGDCFDRVVRDHQARVAIVSVLQGLRYSYGELSALVDRAARGLLALGIDRGDRVAIWSPNRAEWPIVQYAAAKIGAILVTINPECRQPELGDLLTNAGVACIIAQRRFKAIDRGTLLGHLEHGATADQPLRMVYLDDEDERRSWASLLARADRVDQRTLVARQRDVQCEDPALIIYTSGSTGQAKGAVHTHHSLVNVGGLVAHRLALTSSDRICLPIPMFHLFGCVTAHLAALSSGGAVVVPHDAFEPRSCLRAIADERCTAIYGVPTMFSTLLQHPHVGSVDLRSLRTGIIGGARCEPSLIASIVATMHLPELTIGYGLTEMSPVLRSRLAEPLERWADATGVVEPHVECKIVDPQTGRTVPVNVTGELCARGYSMMRGYWNDAAASRRAIDEQGWLHTGDLATMRRDGYVRIVGRLKDLIIRGGENVQPDAIEQVLRQHPDVAEAQVVGVADADYGEEICAWIRWRAGSRGTPESIRAFCQGKLADHAIPRHVLTADAFPTTATGKVRKFELRRMAEAQLAPRERRAGAAGEPETATVQEASR